MTLKTLLATAAVAVAGTAVLADTDANKALVLEALLSNVSANGTV